MLLYLFTKLSEPVSFTAVDKHGDLEDEVDEIDDNIVNFYLYINE